MIIQPLLIAISVSMDAFAVAVGKGLAATRIRPLDALKTLMEWKSLWGTASSGAVSAAASGAQPQDGQQTAPEGEDHGRG